MQMGYAIVFTQSLPSDAYYWMMEGVGYDSGCPSGETATNGLTCWDSSVGKYYEQRYFQQMFDFLETSPEAAALDYDRGMFLFGYSAGAQMASAMIGTMAAHCLSPLMVCAYDRG